MLKVKIKKLHPDAVIPKYSLKGDAGLDLTAISVKIGEESEIIYHTGIAVEIPEGYVGLLFMRSSIYKKDLILTNAVGVIDSNYRGEITFKFQLTQDFWDFNTKRENFQSALEAGEIMFFKNSTDEFRDWSLSADGYAIGDRIGQLLIIPYPQIEFEEVEELSDTIRGTGGFGSTGV